MTRKMTLVLFIALTLLATFGTGCFARKTKGEALLPHSTYGGCRIQGRHYHNTHVFIGDQYEPSLSEWLKY